MNLLKNFTITCTLIGASALLSSCTSVVFPDVIEEDEVVSSDAEQNRKLIEESNSLPADEQNTVYGEQPEAAETAPVTIEVTDGTALDSEHDTITTTQDSYMGETEAAPVDNTPSVSYRSDVFYFSNGSAVLESEYNPNIRELAKTAKEHNATLYIYGYASSRTGNTDMVSHKLANFNVSLERAEAVAKSLRSAGVEKDNIRIEALSDTNPSYLEVMPEGERLNRRVEVYVAY